MTLEDFNKLNLDQKCELIWDWGFFISKNDSDDLNKVLYSLYGFFAEISLRVRDNKIIDVRTYSKINQQQEAEFQISKDNPFVRVTSTASSS